MSKSVKLPSISREYIKVPVMSTTVGAQELRGLPVKFAFLTDKLAEPAEGDWVAGSWEPTGAVAVARCLVGPDAKQLANGTYYVWTRVDQATERPVRQNETKLVIT